MVINNKIGSSKIFAGFTWGEAIRHAGNPEESDTWIVKVTKWDRSSKYFYDYKTIFSHYELKTHGVYRKGRSLRVPKTLNNYVEKVILHNYRNKRLKELGFDDSYNRKIKEFHNIYIK